MKSYSVKSNAKRFTRGIAKQFGVLFVPADPVPAPGSLGSPSMWFPVVEFIGRDFATIPEEVRATCVITNEPAEVDYDAIAQAIKEADNPMVIHALTGPNAEEVAKEVAARGVRVGWVDDINMPHIAEPPRDPDITPADSLAAMAASLPPRVASTPEEIAARRAERRARIGQEKAEGTRSPTGAKPKKISKKKIILDLINRKDGATQAELEAATGWQRHTLRGYIAGTLRKTLAPVGVIECRRGDSLTRYVFVKHEVG